MIKKVNILCHITLATTLFACAKSHIASDSPLPSNLPIPSVPAYISEAADSANYIVSHFWDGVDFTNPQYGRNETFIDCNFTNFARQFRHADRDTLQSAVSSLMHRAEADTVAYYLLANAADKHLYEVNSPMLNESDYLLFLNAITKSDFLDSDLRMRFDYQLDNVLKNRPGSTATDFTFIDTHGKSHTLHNSAKSPLRILFFYDPDCDHCESVIARMQNDDTLTSAIRNGHIEILAVYSQGDEDVWNHQAQSKIPSNWTNSYSPLGSVENDALYIMRTMPTIFLIDSDCKVILKDTDFNRLMHRLADYSF